jgi:hypothetical protein
LRYPEDLFTVQTDKYAAYHMTDPTTFFNKTDLWEVSPDPGSGPVGTITDSGVLDTTGSTTQPEAARSTSTRMAPIYLLIKLPGEPREEFLILRPFVPVSKNNQLTGLVSFMIAKSDPGSYGKLESFVMPTGESVFGPSQVDSQINTTDEISRQFSLLGQRGSTVIQGSMQLIPVDTSILYIRPIYVQASTGSRIPSYRFVIVFYKNKAVVGSDLRNALAQFPEFNGLAPTGSDQPTTSTTTPGGTSPGVPGTVAQLVQDANALFAQAQDALKNGQLGEYQDLINQVGDKLAQADALAGGSTEGGGGSSSRDTAPSTSTTSSPTTSTTRASSASTRQQADARR